MASDKERANEQQKNILRQEISRIRGKEAHRDATAVQKDLGKRIDKRQVRKEQQKKDKK